MLVLPSVTTHSSFTKSVMMSVGLSKVGVVLCRASSEKSMDSIGGISDVSCYQTHCRQQYYLPFSNTAHACTSAWCAQHSSTAAAQNSTSFLLSYSPNKPELNLIGCKIYVVYSSVNMSCKSTNLKESSSDWLNSGNAVTTFE